jgi:hypothetical protein
VTNLNSGKVFSVYPSPATNAIAISGSHGDEMQIYNSAGAVIKFIHVADEGDIYVNVEDFSPGVYLIKSSNACLKFVKE